MTTVTDFGVTQGGFVLEPLDVILGESFDRARSVLSEVDLTSTSPLRKILQTAAAEDGELWKRLEDLYYANFVSTAVGDALDQLGERARLADAGTVDVTLEQPATGRQIGVTNPEPISGGGLREEDEPARSMWTVDAVAQAALEVGGVVDVVLSDPFGGVEVSQSYFDLFNFGRRAFSGEPHFFTVVVAHDARVPWRTIGSVRGVFERVTAAVDRVRPIGIQANIIEADHIDIGVHATLVVAPGSDGAALLASARQRLAADISALRLGDDVRYAQVVRAFVEQPGVLDVQGLHLRRFPAQFGGIQFGGIQFGDVAFQRTVVEAAVGENLAMGPTELATFVAGGDVLDVTVVTG